MPGMHKLPWRILFENSKYYYILLIFGEIFEFSSMLILFCKLLGLSSFLQEGLITSVCRISLFFLQQRLFWLIESFFFFFFTLPTLALTGSLLACFPWVKILVEILPWIVHSYPLLSLASLCLGTHCTSHPSQTFLSFPHTAPAVPQPSCSSSAQLKLTLCSCKQNPFHTSVDLQRPLQVTTSYAHKNISLSCTPVLSAGLHTSPKGHLSVWRCPVSQKRSQKKSLSWVQVSGKYLAVFLKFSFCMEFIITGKRNIQSFSTWNGNISCG